MRLKVNSPQYTYQSSPGQGSRQGGVRSGLVCHFMSLVDRRVDNGQTMVVVTMILLASLIIAAMIIQAGMVFIMWFAHR